MSYLDQRFLEIFLSRKVAMARSSTNYADGGTSNAVHLDGADWRGKSGQTPNYACSGDRLE